jgi:predicted RNA methylase
MKNLIDEKPADPLSGRALYNMVFLSDEDVAGKKVLDIGCGFGWFEFNVLRRGVSHVTGIEHTPESLEAAEKNSLPPAPWYCRLMTILLIL